MKKHFVCGVMLILGFAGFARGAVDISVCRLEETRTAQLVDDKVGRATDQLKITFSLKGPEVLSAVKFGNVHFDEATDDRGTNLIPQKDAFHSAEKFQDYSNSFFRKFSIEQKQDPADPQIEIELGLPKRSATKISHLHGSFELAQPGTIKTLEVPDIAVAGTKKLPLPHEAGVTVSTTVTANEKKSIGLKITGDENAIESIEVMDASGKKISNGISSWTFNDGPPHKSLDVEAPLDGTMKLVVKFAVDRKITKVPIDLKDIPLP